MTHFDKPEFLRLALERAPYYFHVPNAEQSTDEFFQTTGKEPGECHISTDWNATYDS